MGNGLRFTGVKLLAFTLVTIAVTTWLAALIGNLAFFSHPYEVKAEFSDVTGLLRGDVVKAAGVTVGRVEDIAVDRGLALVTISLHQETEIPADVSASIRFRNLIGQRMITLVGPDTRSSEAMLEEGAVIPLERTEPAFDLTALFNNLRPLIRSTSPKDINLVSRAVAGALEGRDDEVEAILGNLADLADTIASKDVQLEQLLVGANAVTEDLSNRGEQLQGTLSDIDVLVTDLDASKADLAQGITVLDEAARRLDDFVTTNASNIEANVDDLAILLDAVNDKRRDLRSALRSLPGFLVGVERVNNYGQWSMVHLVHLCKDDLGTCGARGRPR